MRRVHLHLCTCMYVLLPFLYKDLGCGQSVITKILGQMVMGCRLLLLVFAVWLPRASFVGAQTDPEVVVISFDSLVSAGETTILVCVTYSEGDEQIAWSRNGVPVTTSSLISISEEDATVGGRVFKQSFLELCSVSVSDAGEYTCTVSNGQDTDSATIQLDVSRPAVEVVAISNDTSLEEGHTTLLACVGTGTEISWSINGQTVVNTSRVTVYEEEVVRGSRTFKQSFLQLCSLEISDAGVYTCEVTNGQLTANATTTLDVMPMEGPAEVVALSNYTSLIEGDTTVLACVGYSKIAVDISWSLNGQTIQNSSLITITEEEIVRGSRTFKQSFLQLCSLELSDAGDYTCVVTNGQTTDNATTILSVSRAEAAEIVALSNDTSLVEGETALLACVGYSRIDVDISWSLNGQTVQNSSLITIYEEEIVRGSRTYKQSFLQLCSLELSDAGDYTCEVTNGQTTDNATTILSVSRAKAAEIVALSNDTSLVEGETALLACVGYSRIDVDISWSLNGQTVQNSSLVTIYEEEIVRGSRTFKQSFLQLCSLELSDTGDYTCEVTNGQTTNNATTTLTVLTIEEHLGLSITPSGPLSVLLGGYISFNCSPNATTMTELMYTWTHFDSRAVLDENSNILTLPHISEEELGTYQCSISGGRGGPEVTIFTERPLITDGILTAQSYNESCPSPLMRDDIMVDVLQLLSTQYGVFPLGLTSLYAADSCDRVAEVNPASQSGTYWVIGADGYPTQEYCTFS